MRIGELAERTGVPPRMLRYYEQQGLITASRSDNGYRAYQAGDVDRVRRVRSLITSGVPTKLISSIIDMEGRKPGWTDACSRDLAAELAAEAVALEERIACLQLSRTTIRDYLTRTGHADVLTHS